MELGLLAEIQMGYSFRSRIEHDLEGDVAVVQMRDLDDGHGLSADRGVRVRLNDGMSRHFLHVGDLVFRSRGRSYGAVLVRGDVGPLVLAAPLLLVRPHEVHPEYLYWYLNSRAAMAQLAAVAEGTSVQMISTESLKSLDVPLPSSGVQRRIAAVADLATRERELADRIVDLRHAFTDRVLTILAQEAAP